MIELGDKLEIKKSKRNILTNLFDKNDHKQIQNCGVDPFHVNMEFILMKTYGDQYIVRVYRGKQHYTLHKSVFKKVS